MKKRLNYLLLVLCLLVASACKNGVSTTASGKDEGAGGCEGEKAKAILCVFSERRKRKRHRKQLHIQTVKYIQRSVSSEM